MHLGIVTTREQPLVVQGLLGVAFNQDGGCFGIGTASGFRVYNTDPLSETRRHEFVPAAMQFGLNAKRYFNEDEDAAAGDPGAVKIGPNPTKGMNYVVSSSPGRDNSSQGMTSGGFEISNDLMEALKDDFARAGPRPQTTASSHAQDKPYSSTSSSASTSGMAAASSSTTSKSKKQQRSIEALLFQDDDDGNDYINEDVTVNKNPHNLLDEYNVETLMPDHSSRTPDRKGKGIAISTPPKDSRPTSPNSPIIVQVAENQDADPRNKQGEVPERPELEIPGGIAVVEMLGRSNMVALVGGGRHPKFANNRLLIWDEAKQRVIMEFRFQSEVKAVRLRRERLIVVLLTKVVVYSFGSNPQRLFQFDTMTNDLGLVALSPHSFIRDSKGRPVSATLVCYGKATGQLQHCQLPLTPTDTPSPSPPKKPSISMIAAHSSNIQVISTSQSGHLIATASVTGTLIRVFDARSGRLLSELRRGMDSAIIHCITFNLEATKIVVTSDKGTVHVFNLGDTVPVDPSISSIHKLDPIITSPPPPIKGGDRSYSDDDRVTSSTSRRGSVTSAFNFSSSSPTSSMIATGLSRLSTPVTALASSITQSLSTPSSPTSAAAYHPAPLTLQRDTKASGNTSATSSSSTSTASNRQSNLSFFSPLSKYFSSQWSFAQYTLPTDARSIACFASSDPLGLTNLNLAVSPLETAKAAGMKWSPSPAINATCVVVLCADGSYFKLGFDVRKGGEMTRHVFKRFYRGFDEELQAIV